LKAFAIGHLQNPAIYVLFSHSSDFSFINILKNEDKESGKITQRLIS
jgi:hypothetical protein